MKKFITVLLVVLSLLLITPVVYAQVDITPQIILTQCNRDGCILVWKAILVNEASTSYSGNVIVQLQDKNKNIIVRFNMGDILLAVAETREVRGIILLENSDRIKSIKYLEVIIDPPPKINKIPPKVAI